MLNSAVENGNFMLSSTNRNYRSENFCAHFVVQDDLVDRCVKVDV